MHVSSVNRFSLIKKSVFAVAVCSAIAGISPAMAAGEVNMHILGSVSSSTCDVKPFTEGGLDASSIDLGSLKPDATSGSAPVSIRLKPVNCTASAIAQSKASITWQSPELGPLGLVNKRGSAEGVYVKLSPVDPTGSNPIDTTRGGVAANGVIRQGANTVYYSGVASAKLTSDFVYKLSLEKMEGVPLTSGTVDVNASYAVAYE